MLGKTGALATPVAVAALSVRGADARRHAPVAVTLRGWPHYRAGLDVRDDTTGTQSVYTTFLDYEVMFHVSTMLPLGEGAEQQARRGGDGGGGGGGGGCGGDGGGGNDDDDVTTTAARAEAASGQRHCRGRVSGRRDAV